MSKLITNTIRHTGALSDSITLTTDGTCTAEITNRSNRNLIINGAMNVAQRGLTSTSDGIHTVDRFSCSYGGEDEAPTQAQVDVSAGTTPYTLGFRKAFKITNGYNTGGAGVTDYQRIIYNFESQDIACSGWNFKSSSSYITLSYWIKVSVSQNYYLHFKASDSSTSQAYVMETGTLTAGTWTKVTHKIPGDADLEFDNDTGAGLTLYWWMMRGTNNTGTRALNTWDDFASATITPDQTTTFWTTNDATLELTGVQLEVGSTATMFEHRSYGDELARCQRYYETSYNPGVTVGSSSNVGGYYQTMVSDSSGNAAWSIEYKVQKRAVPSLNFYADDGTANQWDYNLSAASAGKATTTGFRSSLTHLNAYLGVGANWTPCYVLGHWISSSEL